jgi:hypothetical protein
MVAVRFSKMLPVWAENVAEVPRAAMFTAAGTTSSGELLARKILAPPLGAAGDIVTVQLVADPLGTVVGLQTREVSP